MTRSFSAFLWSCLIIIASIGLYNTSDRVQELQRELRSVRAEIDQERQNIHVLRADWTYLSNPSRIEAATKKLLPLHPSTPLQVASVQELPDLVPTRGEAMAMVNVEASPLHNLIVARKMPPPAAPKPVTTTPVKSKAVMVAVNSDHVTDHMRFERTASAEPVTDNIGTLITQLDSNP